MRITSSAGSLLTRRACAQVQLRHSCQHSAWHLIQVRCRVGTVMLIGLQHGLPYMGIKSSPEAVDLLFSQVGCQLLQSTLQILACQLYLRHVTAPPFSSPPLGSLALTTPLTQKCCSERLVGCHRCPSSTTRSVWRPFCRRCLSILPPCCMRLVPLRWATYLRCLFAGMLLPGCVQQLIGPGPAGMLLRGQLKSRCLPCLQQLHCSQHALAVCCCSLQQQLAGAD